jgi:hypothetical protein
MSNPLQETHVEVFIRILSDDQTQRAFVSKEITVAQLISETLNEFTKEKELNENSEYSISLGEQVISREEVIGDIADLSGQELKLGYMQFVTDEQPAIQEEELPKPKPQGQLILEYQGTPSQRYAIRHYPALLGRPSNIVGETSTEILAVDLSNLEDKGKRTVSRRHGRLLRIGGQPAVETLNPGNPVFVNGQQVIAGEPHLLEPDDILRLGNIYLRVIFE